MISFILIKPFTEGVQEKDQANPNTISGEKIVSKTMQGRGTVEFGGQDHIRPVIILQDSRNHRANMQEVNMSYVIEERGPSKDRDPAGKRI